MRDVSRVLHAFVNENWFIDSSNRVTKTIRQLRSQAKGASASPVAPAPPQSHGPSEACSPHDEERAGSPAPSLPPPPSPAGAYGGVAPSPPMSCADEPIVEDLVAEVDSGAVVNCAPLHTFLDFANHVFVGSSSSSGWV